ncbi:MAG: deoxynucleoside kinase [Anaerolineae bacterium]
MPSEHFYIAIEGPIGVGKTTLARILGEALPAEVLLEVFEENPFLSDFYADRARYAFQTQIFFLLSRYRQQHRVIADTLRHSSLVSDYLFAKDWLFAHLNLKGDELQMYERVHAILGEQIPTPDLVVYLRASTDVLMQRIAFRDRPYERQMSRSYIGDLSAAYEAFFAGFTAAPVLSLDTDEMDIVRDDLARAEVVGRVKSALRANGHQLPLPEIEPIAPLRGAPAGRRLADLQRSLRPAPGRAPLHQLYRRYLRLAEEVGALGAALADIWTRQDELLPRVGNQQEAYERAIEEAGGTLQAKLAAGLAVFLQLANDCGVDLESSYLRNRAPKEGPH